MSQNLSFMPNRDEAMRIELALAWDAGHKVGREYEESDVENAYHYDRRGNPYFTFEEQDALWTEAEYGRDISTGHKLRRVPRSLGGSK